VSFTTRLPPGLVIFDCDGVLVDSEGPSNRAVAEEITRLGWPMDEQESTRRFIGCQLKDVAEVVEAHLGRPVPDSWVETLRTRLVDVLASEVELMPGIEEVLRSVTALGLPLRVASNSSHKEMRVKFARTGLLALLPRAHSAYDVPHAKPAPDVFLAAARAEGVAPERCVVIEDSVPGVTGAVAAGMACIGVDAHGDGAELREAGAAHVVHHLLEIPPLLRAALRRAA
jgi:HAD superfamily hydrolase (TIGR01509 family)